MDWTLPDLGEGVQEGEIIQWLVKEGDKVQMDQPLLEIMTDKATVELPAPISGTIRNLKVKPGEIVKIKAVLATLDSEKRETKTTPAVKKEETPSPLPLPLKGGSPVTARDILASPAVRRMAMERGIALASLLASGPVGRILMSDLQRTEAPAAGGLQIPDSIDYGEGKRIPIRGLRRKTAEHMSLSRRFAAHFTHIDEADLTPLVDYREKKKAEATKKGIKLSYLPFIMKAVTVALKKYPYLNASFDERTHEIVLKDYYHIGFAAATEEGLLVPHIKDVDKKNVLQLADELAKLAEAVRNKKAGVDQLRGSTFTVSNVGSIGGMMSMPIINYPEVAIMGVHKVGPRPVVVDGKVVVRQMGYFSISADHRIVDGAYVAEFLNEVIALLKEPENL